MMAKQADGRLRYINNLDRLQEILNKKQGKPDEVNIQTLNWWEQHPSYTQKPHFTSLRALRRSRHRTETTETDERADDPFKKCVSIQSFFKIDHSLCPKPTQITHALPKVDEDKLRAFRRMPTFHRF